MLPPCESFWASILYLRRLRHRTHYRKKTWRHSQNRKYITHSNATPGGSRHGHVQHAEKIHWSSWYMLAYRQTAGRRLLLSDRHTSFCVNFSSLRNSCWNVKHAYGCDVTHRRMNALHHYKMTLLNLIASWENPNVIICQSHVTAWTSLYHLNSWLASPDAPPPKYATGDDQSWVVCSDVHPQSCSSELSGWPLYWQSFRPSHTRSFGIQRPLSHWTQSWKQPHGLSNLQRFANNLIVYSNKKYLKNVGPTRYCEPFYVAIHQVSLLSHAACVSMSTTTTTTTTRDRGDRYGPIEWAQLLRQMWLVCLCCKSRHCRPKTAKKSKFWPEIPLHA